MLVEILAACANEWSPHMGFDLSFSWSLPDEHDLSIPRTDTCQASPGAIDDPQLAFGAGVVPEYLSPI
jgi:hypothetical protein